MTAHIALVVAVARNGVIGKNGKLPWRIAEDMKRFKALTMGKPCIMGRKTWESLPRKPLPGRTNIVVTRNRDFKAQGARLARSFDEALVIAHGERPEEIAVIGGEAIYAAALPHAGRIHLTEVEAEPEGDAYFPPLPRGVWAEIAREPGDAADGPAHSFVVLDRV